MGTGARPRTTRSGPTPSTRRWSRPSYTLSLGDRWLNNGLYHHPRRRRDQLLERSRVQFAPRHVRPQRGHLRRRDPVVALRGRLHRQHQRTGARHPLVHRGQQRPVHGQHRRLLPQREDSTVDLRVHVIPGAMVFDDFATGISGLTLLGRQHAGRSADRRSPRHGVERAGVVADGVGTAGSLVTTQSLITDIAGLVPSTYYLDQNPATPAPCTGDTTAWGQNGSAVVGSGRRQPALHRPDDLRLARRVSDRGRPDHRQHPERHRPSLLRGARLHRGPGRRPGRRHVHASRDQRLPHHRLTGLDRQVTGGVECR